MESRGVHVPAGGVGGFHDRFRAEGRGRGKLHLREVRGLELRKRGNANLKINRNNRICSRDEVVGLASRATLCGIHLDDCYIPVELPDARMPRITLFNHCMYARVRGRCQPGNDFNISN